LRRRHRYATILIDAETGTRIDVLPGRGAEVLEVRLRAHLGMEIVCRDGSLTYGEAVRRALPDAVQVSDESSSVPTLEAKTRSLSCQFAPAALRATSWRSRWSLRASMQRLGMDGVRRDLRDLVSPPSRTERQTMMDGGVPSRSTCDQVSARSSSVRTPSSSDSTVYACSAVPSDALSTVLSASLNNLSGVVLSERLSCHLEQF
jgi:hypothetical protein